jgi:hypothetical protein
MVIDIHEFVIAFLAVCMMICGCAALSGFVVYRRMQAREKETLHFMSPIGASGAVDADIELGDSIDHTADTISAPMPTTVGAAGAVDANIELGESIERAAETAHSPMPAPGSPDSISDSLLHAHAAITANMGAGTTSTEGEEQNTQSLQGEQQNTFESLAHDESAGGDLKDFVEGMTHLNDYLNRITPDQAIIVQRKHKKEVRAKAIVIDLYPEDHDRADLEAKLIDLSHTEVVVPNRDMDMLEEQWQRKRHLYGGTQLTFLKQMRATL